MSIEVLKRALREVLAEYLPLDIEHRTDAEPPTRSDAADLLSRAEAADLLRVTPATVDNLRRAGLLPVAGYVGNRPRWRKGDLLAYIEGQK